MAPIVNSEGKVGTKLAELEQCASDIDLLFNSSGKKTNLEFTVTGNS